MCTFLKAIVDLYRCPESLLNISLTGQLSEGPDLFQFGPGVTCYGRFSAAFRAADDGAEHYDVMRDLVVLGPQVVVPFDPTDTIDNLRLERYTVQNRSKIRGILKRAYYIARPAIPFSIRKQIQKSNLNRWRGLFLPRWPVDTTVEDIAQKLLLLSLQAQGLDRIPFVWFWPKGAKGCVMMTHDVETESGRVRCSELMDLDDTFDIKASFQIVPEQRYRVTTEFLTSIRNRGFEICIQDLNHDGRLFDNREQFVRRSKLINAYAARYGAKGFRAAVLYRKPEWYDALEFSFDMSIPNVASLDPQRGGCCTVMPYFIGRILELPVTTTQDYMLLHLLNERSSAVWKKQIELILEKNGLLSFIVHPDYVMGTSLQPIYEDLLAILRNYRSEKQLWTALPSEVDRWWRLRSKMRVVSDGSSWRIEGEGSDIAVLAYATNLDGNLTYEFEERVVV